jgi:hypothetical protein
MPMVQTLFEQVVVATCLEASPVHMTPQPPQLLGSSAVWVSQPSAATLLQFWYLSCNEQQEWPVAVVIKLEGRHRCVHLQDGKVVAVVGNMCGRLPFDQVGSNRQPSTAHPPWVAGAQCSFSIHTSRGCIGERCCWCGARPAMRSISLQVHLTAIAGIAITVQIPAQLIGGVRPDRGQHCQ